MSRPKKIEETPNIEDLILKDMGEFKISLVKKKLKEDDLKKVIQRLLIEWAQGRVNL